MISDVLLLGAGGHVFAGALLYGLAKSGPQQTLGGIIVGVGFLAAALGGLLWIIGL